jgi:thiamine biosynthesis lipoprotein
MTMLSWPAWGTTARLRVTDPGALHAAQRLAREVFAHAEKAGDRRNPHAEIHRLDGSAGRPIRVSRSLAAMVRAALDAARISAGLVDPTVGNAVVLAEKTGPGTPATVGPWWAPVCAATVPPMNRPAIGWQSVHVDGRSVTVPPGSLLDLDALGKAITAQYCAELINRRLRTGVLVDLGGDLATAGPAPADGWPAPGRLGPLTAGAGLATVSHPVVDPRTGRPASAVWSSVLVRRSRAEGAVVTAKALAVAAAVTGPAAALWLDEQGVCRSARLLTPTTPLPRPAPWRLASTS